MGPVHLFGEVVGQRQRYMVLLALPEFTQRYF